ncbi:hypothetical protein ABNM01_21530 [Pseudomonas syringae]
MQGKPEAAVLDFVGQTFGEKCVARLKNIGRGGGNNKKGGDFENFYAASQICMLGGSHGSAAEDFFISCQEAAFVDDVCVRHIPAAVKTNYQAKNSAGSAADWDDEMQERFEMQQTMDLGVHEAASSFQILLVSDAEKAAANDAKIPAAMKAYSKSEHFPYHKASPELIGEHAPLRIALAKLCNTHNLATLDTAFRVVLGEWCADNSSGRNVGEILLNAKRALRPNILPGVVGPVGARPVPSWLGNLLMAFQLPPATVECGAFQISSNGFTVAVEFDVPEPSPRMLEKVQSRGDVFDFLMSLEAERLVNQQPIGDHQ